MSQRPFRRRMQARAMRIINVPMRVVLGLPFPTPLGNRLMLITHVGRKTGRVYRQPVSYVAAGDTLLTPGGGRWTRNLREQEPVPIRLRGRDVVARPELVSDADEVDRLLAVMAATNRRIYGFIGIPRDAEGHLEREPLQAAIKHGFRIVRWKLA